MTNKGNTALSKQEANRIAQAAAPQQVRSAYAQLNSIATHAATLLSSGKTAPGVRLAAEQIVHLVDAWRYLSGSIHAYLNHSSGIAIHQAYYAELRAALSLFAGSGIRICDGKNSYVDSKGAEKSFGGSTHSVTWTLWTEWAKTSDAQEILRNEIAIMPNVTLGAFEAHIGAQQTTVGALSLWGYDLLQLKRDRFERNKQSYEPYWTTVPLTMMDPSDVAFVKSLWSLLLPKTYGCWGFDVAYIVYLITKSFQDAQAANAKFSPKKEYIRLLKEVAGKTGTDYKHVNLALTQEQFDISLFELAADSNTNPKNVLSRATFLLRIAMLSLKANLTKYDVPNASGTKWIRNWLHHAGLWHESSTTASQDIHLDFREMLDQFAPGVDLPYSIWDGSENAVRASRLCRPDASIIWGLY